MTCRPVKCLCKLAFLLNYFSNVYLVVDGLTVAVVGALDAGVVGAMQVYYGYKVSQSGQAIEDKLTDLEASVTTLQENISAIETKFTTLHGGIITKNDLKNLCLRYNTSIFKGYPK